MSLQQTRSSMGLYLFPTAAFQSQVNLIGPMAANCFFSWRETGGPKVSQPTRKGFGSAILVESAEEFGHATVKYEPEGLIYEIKLDLTTIEISKTS